MRHAGKTGISFIAIGLATLVALSCGKDSTGPGPTVELIACDSTTTGGWFLTRGFYVDSFPGVNLSQVDLYVSADAAGSYGVALTVRLATYDGTVVTSDTTAVSSTGASDSYVKASFTFPDPKIQKGALVTFDAEQLSGAGTAFLQGSDVASCIVHGTNDKTPPLSTPQASTISGRRISILGSAK
jgi:hypothetical protein